MFRKILQLCSLACGHKNISQPFAAAASTPRSTSSEWDSVLPAGQHYVVCLECGQKFDYDWNQMRVMA